MGIPKYAAKRDENEPEIVQVFEAHGWTVHRINDKGFPDLVCGRNEKIRLVEVLGPGKLKNYRRTGGLTPAQVLFHEWWPGTIYKVRNVEEAMAVAACADE